MFEEENDFNYKNELNVRKRKLASFGRANFVISTRKTVISCRDGSFKLKGSEEIKRGSMLVPSVLSPTEQKVWQVNTRVILHLLSKIQREIMFSVLLFEVPKNSDEEK